jgi:hypothetical protein
VQPPKEVQSNKMEIDMIKLRATNGRRRTTILDRTTLLDRGIHIPNLNKFMWIQTKHNYDKHVERLKHWKDINEEEEWVDKARFVTLFFMKWETLVLDIMLKFMNTFVIKGTNIYFGYKNKVYVINK